MTAGVGTVPPAPKVRRGLRRVTGFVLAAVGGLAVLAGANGLSVVMAPSDPCVEGGSCGPGPGTFLLWGGLGLVLGLLVLVVGVRLVRGTAVVFRPPPGWPAPAAGWRPEPGWQPSPGWPPAPDGWAFWTDRSGRPVS